MLVYDFANEDRVVVNTDLSFGATQIIFKSDETALISNGDRGRVHLFPLPTEVGKDH